MHLVRLCACRALSSAGMDVVLYAEVYDPASAKHREALSFIERTPRTARRPPRPESRLTRTSTLGGQKRPLKINKFLCRCGLASPMGDQGQLWLFGPPESLATPFGLNAGLCSFGDHLLRSRQLPGARVCPSSPILSSPSDRVRACSPAVRARLRTELGEIVPNAYHLAAPGRRHIPPGPAPLSTLPKARIAPHSARRAFQKRPTWRRRSSRRST